MEIKAKLNYLRISPRKVRLVANLIRKKKIEEARTILDFTVKKAAKHLLKLLDSAVNNAHNNFQLEPSNLYISKITVDGGPKHKKWRPRARGRATEIQKKTSHITLVLEEIGPTKKVKKPKKVKEKSSVVSKEKEEVEKAEREEVPEKETLIEKPEFRPTKEARKPKPRIIRGIKRIFRRKAF